MLKHVLTVYGYGYDIDAIAYDVDMTEEEVLEMLVNHKKENMSGRKFSDELKNLIIDRFKSGITPFTIDKELGMGKGVAKRLLIKEGLEVPKTKSGRKAVVTYTVIQHENFQKCPDCKSEKVTDLSKQNLEEEVEVNENKRARPHSYCKECGTEWYEAGSKDNPEIHKVLFHELDEEQDED